MSRNVLLNADLEMSRDVNCELVQAEIIEVEALAITKFNTVYNIVVDASVSDQAAVFNVGGRAGRLEFEQAFTIAMGRVVTVTINFIAGTFISEDVLVAEIFAPTDITDIQYLKLIQRTYADNQVVVKIYNVGTTTISFTGIGNSNLFIKYAVL